MDYQADCSISVDSSIQVDSKAVCNIQVDSLANSSIQVDSKAVCSIQADNQANSSIQADSNHQQATVITVDAAAEADKSIEAWLISVADKSSAEGRITGADKT